MASTSALTAVVERLIEQTRNKWKEKDQNASIYKKTLKDVSTPQEPMKKAFKQAKKPKLLN